MKNVLLVCVVILGLGVANANAHEGGVNGVGAGTTVVGYFYAPRPVVVRSISPRRVVGSFCRYGAGVGKRAFCGVGQIITAPFKQPLVMPARRTFIYVPARWYYSPSRVMEVSPVVIPKAYLETPPPPPPNG